MEGGPDTARKGTGCSQQRGYRRVGPGVPRRPVQDGAAAAAAAGPEGQVKCIPSRARPSMHAHERHRHRSLAISRDVARLSPWVEPHARLPTKCLRPQVPKFMGGAEHTLRAEVTLVASTRDKKPWGRPPIQLQFQVGSGAIREE